MGLFKEAHAAGDLVVDIVAGQLHLQFHGVVVGPVEDGDVGEVAALIQQCTDALKDEAGLAAGVHNGHEIGFVGIGFNGAEFFVVSLPGRLIAEDGVGQIENLGSAAVIGLDLVQCGLGVALVEAHDIFEIGTAPGVDALSVISDRHYLVMDGDGVDNFGLQTIGILEFIDEDVFEAFLIKGGDIGMFAQEFEEVFKQVVVVGHLLFELHFLIGLKNSGDFFSQPFEEGKFILGELPHSSACVAGKTDAVGEVFWFGVVFGLYEFRIDLLDGVFEEGFGFAFINDGVVAFDPDLFSVHAEDALGDTVKGAAPELAAGNAGQVLDPLKHFTGGFVGEGEEEDFSGLHALMQEVGDAVGQGAGLARSGAGENKIGTGLGSHSGVLLVIEFGAKVDGRESVIHVYYG